MIRISLAKVSWPQFLVSIFQCDAVERFGPKYLVAGCLGWPLGRSRSTGAFSQIRIPEAHGRWAPVRGRGCGSAPAGPAYPAIPLRVKSSGGGNRNPRVLLNGSFAREAKREFHIRFG